MRTRTPDRPLRTSRNYLMTALSRVAVLAIAAASSHLQAQAPNHWTVPAGFQVSIFADSVQNAREMALGPRGTVFVGSMTLVGDRLLALVDFTKAVVVPYRPSTAQQAVPPAAAPTKAEQEVLDLSKLKWRWMAEKKADTLAALFHDKAVFVHMGGSWGKAQEVEIIRSGGIHYKHAEIFEASARLIDSTAIVLSRIRLDAVVGGNEVTNPFMVTEVYVQQQGAWKLASLSFTRLVGQ